MTAVDVPYGGHWGPGPSDACGTLTGRCHGGHRTHGDAFAGFNAAVDEEMPIESPDYWRQRAAEARTRSEHMLDSITKALLLDIANSYERIAKAYEEQTVLLEQPRGTKGR